MPSLRMSTRYSPPAVMIEGTQGLPWRLSIDGDPFTSGQGDMTVRLGILTGGVLTLTLDVVSFPLVREQVFGLVASPPPPTLPPLLPPPEIPPEVAQPGGYWKVGAASPNDSTSRFIGAKFGSYADCVRSWQSFGYGGTGGCSYVPPPGPSTGLGPGGSLPDWQNRVGKAIGDLVGSVNEALGGIGSRLTALEEFLKDFWQKLEDWLVERLVGLMLRALNEWAKAARRLQ